MNDSSSVPSDRRGGWPFGQKVAVALLLVIVIGSPLAYWASDGRFPVMPSKTKAVQIPQPVKHQEWSQPEVQPTRPPCADGWDQGALDGLCYPNGYLPLKEQAARRCSTETVASDQALAIECLLRSWLRDLQNSQKEVADRVEEVQRQLASQQSELKLLSGQVGVLAGRLESLSADPPARAASPKSKKTPNR
jgi:hypothetical protein